MGSVGNRNPWAPSNNYYFKDCSQGICSIYCPQWCYIVFPPPPPLGLSFSGNDDTDDIDSGINFSPLIIAVIGILASAFLLITYYTIISKYCNRRRSNGDQNNHQDQQLTTASLAATSGSAGLDEVVIKSITVRKYKRGDGSVEGTDCSVCLSEFEEDESLRLLPKCNHAFHISCIDPWLKSHSNCPLCRSNIVIGNNPLPPNDHQVLVPNSEIRANQVGVAVLEYRSGRSETIVVVHELVEPEQAAVVCSSDVDVLLQIKNPNCPNSSS